MNSSSTGNRGQQGHCPSRVPPPRSAVKWDPWDYSLARWVVARRPGQCGVPLGRSSALVCGFYLFPHFRHTSDLRVFSVCAGLRKEKERCFRAQTHTRRCAYPPLCPPSL